MAKAHQTKDEYDWSVYTKEYSAQVLEMEKTAGNNGSDFIVRRWGRTPDGSLEFLDNLHGNWKILYTTIDKLKPHSVFECGCGGMYHLNNIKTLFPNIEVNGCDLLQTQIDFGSEKFNISKDILQNVSVRDFSEQNATDSLGEYDLVYSHAVIMHISTEKAIAFLGNMLKIAKKHVVLIEGEQHNYYELLEELGETDNWVFDNSFGKSTYVLTRV